MGRQRIDRCIERSGEREMQVRVVGSFSSVHTWSHVQGSTRIRIQVGILFMFDKRVRFVDFMHHQTGVGECQDSQSSDHICLLLECLTDDCNVTAHSGNTEEQIWRSPEVKLLQKQAFHGNSVKNNQ